MKRKTKMKTTKLYLEVEFNPRLTDPEGLANAVDRLLETVLSTPGIMDEYDNPRFGPCWVQVANVKTSGDANARHRAGEVAGTLR